VCLKVCLNVSVFKSVCECVFECVFMYVFYSAVSAFSSRHKLQKTPTRILHSLVSAQLAKDVHALISDTRREAVANQRSEMRMQVDEKFLFDKIIDLCERGLPRV